MIACLPNIPDKHLTTINMDVVVTEEARVSADDRNKDDRLTVNGSKGEDAISDPDHKFQKAIAAWRGTHKSKYLSLGAILMNLQALICRPLCRSSMLQLPM